MRNGNVADTVNRDVDHAMNFVIDSEWRKTRESLDN